MFVHGKRNIPAAAICTAVIVLSLLIRIWFARSELWYDEILSIVLSEHIGSPWGILTQIHHDNSHYLNTLYLWLLGFRAPYLAYHGVSLFFGTLLQVAVSMYAFRRSTREGVILTVLTSFSFFLFLYGWQARGYAPMLFFGLLSYFFLSQYLAHPKYSMALLYGASACIAFLWHLTYLHFLLGFFLWSTCILRRRYEWKVVCIHLLRCFLLPVAFLFSLYVVDIRVMEIGGGEKKSLDLILQTILTTSIGFPSEGTLLSFVLSACIFWGIVAAVERRLHHSSNDALLFILMLVVVPAVSLLCLRPTFVYPRYFLPSIFFLILLYARTAADMYDKGSVLRVLSLVFVALYCAGNIVTILSYAPLVSGGHVPALSSMAANSVTNSVRVGSTSDSHNSSILYFYSKRLSQDFQYVPQAEAVVNPPQWFLKDKSAFEIIENPQIFAYGISYCLQSALPQNGHRWAVYLRCEQTDQF